MRGNKEETSQGGSGLEEEGKTKGSISLQLLRGHFCLVIGLSLMGQRFSNFLIKVIHVKHGFGFEHHSIITKRKKKQRKGRKSTLQGLVLAEPPR